MIAVSTCLCFNHHKTNLLGKHLPAEPDVNQIERWAIEIRKAWYSKLSDYDLRQCQERARGKQTS